MAFVSVIVCSIDAQKFARVTANHERAPGAAPHAIVGIHDARSLGCYDDRWDAHRRRFVCKHARHLAPSLPRRNTPLSNVPLDKDVVAHPAEVARLCRPETLARLLPGAQRAMAP